MVTLLLQLKVFLFIMAIFVVLVAILHTIAVFRLKNGKLVSSKGELALFGASLAYILTMLIVGF